MIDAVESLSREISPIGVKTLLVEPGTFRTEFLNPNNQRWASSKHKDYQELTSTVAESFEKLAGNQIGDPRKGAELVVDVVKGENGAKGKEWPSSLLLGSDAVELIRRRCEETLRELCEWEEFSRSSDL